MSEHPLPDSSVTPRGHLIPREGLLERLDLARLGRVSLVQAPAGYGKSTLLGAWCSSLSRQGIETISLSLDEDLAAPERLFSALRRAIAHSTSQVSPLMHEVNDRRSRAPVQLARQLSAMLKSRTDPLVIVLDDYHRVASDELDVAFGEFLRSLPPGTHMCLSSRPPIGIPVAVMSLQATLTRLELKDLRFSDMEINQLFANELNAEELASISVWTEGWPIAVQLARTYLQNQSDRSGALARLSAQADRDVGRYLTEQVLGRLDAADRDVLITTSFLERLEPDLVDAVTGVSQAWRTLERLAAANVIVAEIDGGQSSIIYRCHHLLREALYAELCRRGRAEVLRVRARAGQWLRLRGRLDDALRHGRAAEDYDLVAEIILQKGGILYGVRYGSPELRRLLEYLPPEQFTHNPRLRLAQCFELVKTGRMDAAQDILQAVRKSIPGGTDRDPLLARDLALAEISIAAYSGTASLGASQVAMLESAIQEAGAGDDLWRAILNNLLAAMYYRRSQFADALAAGEAALYGYNRCGALNGAAHAHLHLGLIHMELANTDAAVSHWSAAKANFGAGDLADEAGAAVADLLMSEALYEKGQLAEARALCSTALPSIETGEHFYPVFASAYRTFSGICLVQEGLAASLGVLNSALRIARRRRLSDIERSLELRRAEVQLQAGEFSRLNADSTGKIPMPVDIHATSSPHGWWEKDCQSLLGARLLLLDGDCEGAITLLRDLDAKLALEGRARSRIAALILLAGAHYQARRRDAAAMIMRQGISLAATGPTLKAFLEDGRLALPILIHLSAGSNARGLEPTELRLVDDLIVALQARMPVGAMLFAPRELEILQQLILGNNNKLIARALGITPDTVRFHLKKIYEKLGVNDRKVVVALVVERDLLRTVQSDPDRSSLKSAPEFS